MKIKWLGQSGFKIDDLLIDPWVIDIKSWGLKAPHTWIEEDKNVQTMVFTHMHEDHCNGALDLAKEKDMLVVGTPENTLEAIKMGIRVDSLWIGGFIKVNDWEIALTKANHAPNATGAILKKDDIVIYHAGDTGLFSDMKLIKELFHPDIALLPIGGRFTMDEKQASIAAEYIGAKIVVPMHYNTFPLIMADDLLFTELVNKRCDSEVKILKVGEEFSFVK